MAVTALIPAYNAASTLARALASVAVQTRPADAVLVVDDGSSDQTAAIAANWPGVTLIRHQHNQGSSAALNTGLAAAQTELIAFLDADDEWLPDKLERQLAVHAGVMSATASEWVDAAGVRLHLDGTSLPRWVGAEFWRAQFARAVVTKPTVIANRAAMLDVGGFDTGLRSGEDQDMWLRLAFAGSIAYLPEVLARVHVSPRSLTAQLALTNYRTELALYRRHADSVRARLPLSEAEDLIAARLAVIGKDLCAAGAWSEGAPLLWRALLRGQAPATQAQRLLATLPLLQPLKRLLR
jgi:glycosyltransferase involved in cell wall biosynthesis